jgi:hypothetical protein
MAADQEHLPGMSAAAPDGADDRAGGALGASFGEARLALTNLRQQARPAVLLPPIILLIVVFVLAYVFRPSSVTAPDRADYETFFTTAATVLGTILIAIVLQANLFRGPSLRRMLIYGLLYIALGEVAALIALLPGGSEHLQGVLFALTMSAGIGALIAVLYIGIQLLESPSPELEMQPDGTALLDDAPAKPATSATPASQTRSTPADAPAAEASEFGEFGRPNRPGQGTRGSFILLHPDAIADLQKLGPRESRLVLRITERVLADERAWRKRAVSDGDWFELRAGGLRIVFRPLSPGEAAEHGRERGSLVRRVLAEKAAQRWLQTVAQAPGVALDDAADGVRLGTGRSGRRPPPPGA